MADETDIQFKDEELKELLEQAQENEKELPVFTFELREDPKLVAFSSRLEDSSSVRWKVIENKFSSLSDEVREFLASDGVINAVRTISDTYKLSNAQIKEISKIIKEIFVGEMPIERVINTLASRLNIERDLSFKMSQEIKNKILIPQKEFLLKLYPQKERIAIGSPQEIQRSSTPIPRPSVEPKIGQQPGIIKPLIEKVGAAPQKVLPSSWETKFKTVVQEAPKPTRTETSLQAQPLPQKPPLRPVVLQKEQELKFRVEPQYGKTALQGLRDAESALAPSLSRATILPKSNLPMTASLSAQGVHLDDLYEKVKKAEGAERQRSAEGAVSADVATMPKVLDAPLAKKEIEPTKSVDARLHIRTMKSDMGKSRK